jgi:hypothetical protein
LKLKCDASTCILISKFAFKFNLYHYCLASLVLQQKHGEEEDAAKALSMVGAVQVECS